MHKCDLNLKIIKLRFQYTRIMRPTFVDDRKNACNLLSILQKQAHIDA